MLEASTGEEALKIARETIPDIILLDIMMPGKLDGYDVCRSLKKDTNTKDIYIVMLTAKGQKADIERGKAACADDYFVKPFSPMELINKIDNIL
jgi:DNA-binding response OmpR family regulator